MVVSLQSYLKLSSHSRRNRILENLFCKDFHHFVKPQLNELESKSVALQSYYGLSNNTDQYQQRKHLMTREAVLFHVPTVDIRSVYSVSARSTLKPRVGRTRKLKGHGKASCKSKALLLCSRLGCYLCGCWGVWSGCAWMCLDSASRRQSVL